MPKIVDSEQYRRELLHKCFDLFADKGYANVTTRQISKELGISTGALYHYFPSKQALFEQLVEEVSQQDVQLLRSTAGGQTLAQRIERLGQLLIQNEDYFVKQIVIWVDFYQHHPLSEISSNPVFQQVDQRSQQAIAEVLKLNDFNLAQFIWTLINGILIEQVERHVNFPFADQIELLTQMLIAYFEKHPPH